MEQFAMGAYDSPGYLDQIPGFAPRSSHDYGSAPGSAGDRAEESYGPVIGSPAVSAPYGSSQLPANRPEVPVRSGGTSGMSSDQSVQQSIFLPGGEHGSSPSETGAGRGRAQNDHLHVNSHGVGP